jgi:hypothetical protein
MAILKVSNYEFIDKYKGEIINNLIELRSFKRIDYEKYIDKLNQYINEANPFDPPEQIISINDSNPINVSMSQKIFNADFYEKWRKAANLFFLEQK